MRKYFFFFVLFSVVIVKLSAQGLSNCKCRYPFELGCFEYCVEKLLPNEKFQQTLKSARIADSTLTKLQNWAQAKTGEPLSAFVTRREISKLETAVQTYYQDPGNNERSTSRFMHGVGATISVLFGKDGLNDFSLAQTNFCYYPRLNLLQSDNNSLSIGTPLGLGVGIANNSFGGDVGIAFAYDLPVALDFNFGCKSTRNATKNFGGYVGAGFGYYHVSISQSAYSDFSGSTYGPMARAGVRFSNDNWDGKAITFGLFYKKGMEDLKLQTIGFNVLAEL